MNLLGEPNLVSVAVLSVITALRLGELVYARRNVAQLRAMGAVEHGAEHYPFMLALHTAFLAGLWLLAWSVAPAWPWLVVLVVLQLLRLWVLFTLGRRWTTRVFVLPGVAPIAAGPYRWLRHPNYAVVVGEMFAMPMAYGLLAYALVFSALNAAMLVVRIRAEDRALRAALGAAQRTS